MLRLPQPMAGLRRAPGMFRSSGRGSRSGASVAQPAHGRQERFAELSLWYAECYLGGAELDRLLTRAARADHPPLSVPEPTLGAQLWSLLRRWTARLRGAARLPGAAHNATWRECTAASAQRERPPLPDARHSAPWCTEHGCLVSDPSAGIVRQPCSRAGGCRDQAVVRRSGVVSPRPFGLPRRLRWPHPRPCTRRPSPKTRATLHNKRA